MLTLATTEDKFNDIHLDLYNNLATTTDIEAVANVCKNVILTKYNELLYNQGRGIKYFEYIFNDIDIPNLQVNIVEELEKINEVVKVLSFEYEIKNKIFSYRVLIQTIFGEVVVNG